VAEFDLNDLRRRMLKTVEDLGREFGRLRTGRASTSLLEPIMVEAYGQSMPLNQVGSVNVAEARLLSVQVWDRSQVQAVEKAIRSADLGLNPAVDGQTVRVPIPELNEERRREFTKLAAKYAEDHRVALRNIRRAGMELLKENERSGDLSKDEQRALGDKVQDLTNEMVSRIDEVLATKGQEIMQV
jgi:ribosome recycling factor